MMMFGQCLSAVTQCLYGEAEDWTRGWKADASDALLRPKTLNLNKRQNSTSRVVLDTTSMGGEAVVVKNCTRLCGHGAARASCPISQGQVYWEARMLMHTCQEAQK